MVAMRWFLRCIKPTSSLDADAIIDRHGEPFWLATPTSDRYPTLIELVGHHGAAGFVELSWSQEDMIENFGIMIHQSYRGRGLGTALLRALTAWLRRRRVVVVRGFVRRSDLNEHPHLLDWYARHGFTVTPVDSVVTAAFLTCNLRRRFGIF
ncbi:MAG: GNAT family N-acetyltransferase [Chloroflexales bacterium]|nr:GNAT family N-acetyltransferase [Chloroflexales bacterium]